MNLALIFLIFQSTKSLKIFFRAARSLFFARWAPVFGTFGPKHKSYLVGALLSGGRLLCARNSKLPFGMFSYCCTHFVVIGVSFWGWNAYFRISGLIFLLQVYDLPMYFFCSI